MPWQEPSRMELRQEFVTLARQEGTNIRDLCRRYRISAKTGDTWLRRADEAGAAGLRDRSRRPRTSPTKTVPAIEERVVALRGEHPTWGGRTIHAWLERHGVADGPAPSTVTAILRRHGLLAADPAVNRHWQRFERDAPNELWQVDFLGHRPVDDGQRGHPLTVVDDHSRDLLGLVACTCERQTTVQEHLTACYRRSGLPQAILTDNGPPWGTSGAGGMTALEAWLLRWGIAPRHGRAYHPQTQGKVERLHGTIVADVFAHRSLPTIAAGQPAFDTFRQIYNRQRPHEALGYAVPADRYQVSPRGFPEVLPELVSGPGDQVRKVRDQGAISFRNRSWFISRGLIGREVGVRPTTTDGVFQVLLCHRAVATIDLTDRWEV